MLSTPPAFVLSQDQTLQHKLFGKSIPTIQKEIAEENQPPQRWKAKLGTGLSKHPVEFSRNKHPPQPDPHQGGHVSGATSSLYPTGFALSTPLSRDLRCFARNPTRRRAPLSVCDVPGREPATPADPATLQWRPARLVAGLSTLARTSEESKSSRPYNLGPRIRAGQSAVADRRQRIGRPPPRLDSTGAGSQAPHRCPMDPMTRPASHGWPSRHGLIARSAAVPPRVAELQVCRTPRPTRSLACCTLPGRR